MISVQKVSLKNKNIQKVKALYHEAFPEIERLPLTMLHLMALKSNIDFLAVYDDDVFVGLLYLVSNQTNTLLYYLAVNQTLRSKGYGSQILTWLKTNKTSVISLIMETVHEPCDDLEKRLARKNFYLRNGFIDTGYYMKDYAGIFDILSTDATLDPTAFMQLIHQFTFWLRDIEVKAWQN